MVSEGNDQTKKRTSGRERSPNHPSHTLTEAIKLARDVWDHEKRTAVPAKVVAGALGYKSLSGPARSAIGTLRQFGMLEGGSDGLRLSELALEILHHPKDSQERDDAIRTAALKPKLFRELAKTHLEASDSALLAYLLTRKGFSDTAAARCIRSFRDTMSLANLEASGYNGTDMAETTEAAMEEGVSAAAIGSIRPGSKPRVTLFSWPLAKGVTAEVRFIGDSIGATHLERLRQYLDLAKEAVESDDEEKAGD